MGLGVESNALLLQSPKSTKYTLQPIERSRCRITVPLGEDSLQEGVGGRQMAVVFRRGRKGEKRERGIGCPILDRLIGAIMYMGGGGVCGAA